MDRAKLLELWNDMWLEGNWVPSWPDSLKGLTAAEAALVSDVACHSIWQETVHVIYWRNVTLRRLEGSEGPTEEEIERLEFAAPDTVSDEAWAATVVELERTQRELAALVQDETKSIERIIYHIIHDAYHLGRITQIRAKQGTVPKF